MWIWPLILVSLAFAEDPETEKYCFGSVAQRERAHRELKDILVPSDQVTAREECLVVLMRPHRRELIQNYVRRIAPNASVSFSSTEITRDPCQLKVEKIREGHKESTGVSANKDVVGATRSDQESNGRDVFEIQTLKDFELSVNQDIVKGTCRFLSPDRYEITLTVAKVPKPIAPGAPAGSIVIITTPPPDQDLSILQTTLQLTRGQRVEIGSVVKDLREKNHGVSLGPQISAGNVKGSTSEKTYLSLDQSH